ncbi:MAG: right-handed parallel beta-helix repeat-containing protein, partial [Dokdonella sp.]
NNLIGVAANGITPVPNFTGIGLGGGGCTVTSNRIVGNNQDAILINGGNGNVIQGNVLGVDINGNGIFNSGAGVHITSGNNNVIGTSATSSITGTLLSNTIRFMVDGGVVAGAGTGNSIRSNLIYDNGTSANAMDIDLGVVGPTSNDADDTDSGPNLLQNFPLGKGVAFATPPAPNAIDVPATLSGTLNAQPGNYRVDAYFANGCSANGRGHAAAYAGATLITIAAGSTKGTFTFGAMLPNVQADGMLAFAATDAAGNTSEIGPCMPLDVIFRDGYE